MNNRNKSGFCTEISQNFALVLDFSANLDIFQHICKIHDFSFKIQRKIAVLMENLRKMKNEIKKKKEELFSSAKTADSQVEQQFANRVSTKKGPMRRLTRAFSNQEVDSPIGSEESDGESQNSCSQPSTPASPDDLSLQSPSEGPPRPHEMESEELDSPLASEVDESVSQWFD